MSKNILSKSAYEKELMALLLEMQHWRPYLLSREFVVYSYPEKSTPLVTTKGHHSRPKKRIAKLLGYHFKVVYKSGPYNKAADALSKMYGEVESNV